MAEEKKEEEIKEEVKEETKKESTARSEEEKKEENKEEAKKEKKDEKKQEKKQEEEEVDVKIPEKFKKIVEGIEKLSVLDLSELVKVLEKKFGVTAAMPVAAPASTQTGAGAPAEEKKIFNIFLNEIGDKKIEVIKAVRDITQKGLKEAKDLVDAAASSPQMVKENVKKEEAEEIKKKLEAAGAKVELK